jgi:hypothetical protein
VQAEQCGPDRVLAETVRRVLGWPDAMTPPALLGLDMTMDDSDVGD